MKKRNFLESGDRINQAENAISNTNKIVESALLETVIPLKDGAIFAVYHALSVMDFLLFQEKSLKPGSVGATARAIGPQNAVEWIIAKAYSVGERQLTSDYMDEMQLEVKDLNALLSPIFSVDGQVICHDDAPSFLESNDFEFDGKRIKLKPIPWRYAFNLQAKAEQSMQAAYKDLFMRFITINDDRVTEESMSDKSISTAIATLIFQRLSKKLA